VTLEALCKENMTIRDISNSTAHVSMGNKTAHITEVDISLIDLPEEFWTSCSVAEFRSENRLAQNEAHVKHFFGQLVKAVMDALEVIGYFESTNPAADIVPQVHVMDVIPDLCITFGRNCYLGATIEIKKHVEGQLEDIFGSQVAGQAFEQLYLSKLGLKSDSYGLISTCNSVLLVSTGDFQAGMKDLRTRLAGKDPKPTQTHQGGPDTESANSGGTTESRINPDLKLPAPAEALKTMRDAIEKSEATESTEIGETVDNIPYDLWALPKANVASKTDFESKEDETA
jgi:hypothetical protein